MIDVATRRGIAVRWASLGARHGEYAAGVVTINEDRPEEVQRIIMAHELGHAFHGHEPAFTPSQQERQERQADEHAAILLVNRSDYERAERMYGPAVGAVAAELGVPARFVYRLRSIQRRDAWPSWCGTCRSTA
jgi:Zn-dependent peptidase ImmA (M78 family)